MSAVSGVGSGVSSITAGHTYILTPTIAFDQSQSDPITGWSIGWGDSGTGGGVSVSGDPSQFTHFMPLPAAM